MLQAKFDDDRWILSHIQNKFQQQIFIEVKEKRYFLSLWGQITWVKLFLSRNFKLNYSFINAQLIKKNTTVLLTLR